MTDPVKKYSPDNPFASGYSPDNPFANDNPTEPPKKRSAWRDLLSLDRKMAESAMDMATLGTSGFVADAATAALTPQTFTELRDARRARRESMPWYASLASAIPAMAVPMAPALGVAKQGAGLLRIAGKGAAEGVIQGAATGFGENVGTTDGVTLPVVAGGGIGGLLGAIAAPVTSRLAVKGMLAATERASRRLARADEVDAALPLTAPQLFGGPGMPRPMEIDRVGPTVRAEVKSAGSTPAGRAELERAFRDREAGLPDALNLGVKDAKVIEARLKASRAEQADADYTAAVEATKGKAVEAPSLDELMSTPTGRAAWNEVLKSRPDLVIAEADPKRALPKVKRSTTVKRPEGFETFSGDAMKEVVVPDAEAIHLMTRYLRNWSKGEKGQLFPEGVNAESAQNAAKLLERAKAELPAEFRLANENYEAASRKIDAVQTGLAPWKNNPNPLSRKANKLSMVEVSRDVRKMSPENRELVRTAKAFDLVSRFNDNGLTPATAVERMNRPRSSMGREIKFAGGGLGDKLRAWDDVLARQNDLLSGTSPAPLSEAGVDVTGAIETGVSINPLWWATQAGRRMMAQKRAADRLAKRSAEDAVIAGLATDQPLAIANAISTLRKMDQARGRIASRAATKAGRFGGSLFDIPRNEVP